MARPTTIAIAAITIDGKIARNSNELVRWTSKEDKELFRSLTKDIGVMILGKRTFDTFPAPLPGRLHIVMTRDTTGLQNSAEVEYTSKSIAHVLEDLGNRGYARVAIAGGSTIYSMFVKAKLLDELLVTVEPKIFGDGVSLFHEFHEVDCSLVSHKLINQHSVLLHYQLRYS